MSADDDVEMAPAPQAKDKGKAREPGLSSLGLDVLPWVEKYRPVTLDDVVAHGDIISTSEPSVLSEARSGRTRADAFCVSRPVHRQKPRAPSPLLRSTGNGKDVHYPRRCSQGLWHQCCVEEQLLGGVFESSARAGAGC